MLVGTGKYADFAQTRAAIDASGAEIITVAIRRTNIGQNAGEPSLLDFLPPEEFTYLPNTAGCYSAEDAVRTLRLARELLAASSAATYINWVNNVSSNCVYKLDCLEV